MYEFDGFRLTPRAPCYTLEYKVQTFEVFVITNKVNY